MSLTRVAMAVAAMVGAAQAGIVALPLDDEIKMFAAFGLGLATTFFGVLFAPEPGASA